MAVLPAGYYRRAGSLRLFVPRGRAAAKRLLRCAGAALAVCLLYAAGDELHQYFVPGRACLATDILVDALGFAPCVLAVCGLWHWLACRRARRRQTGDPNAG